MVGCKVSEYVLFSTITIWTGSVKGVRKREKS